MRDGSLHRGSRLLPEQVWDATIFQSVSCFAASPRVRPVRWSGRMPSTSSCGARCVTAKSLISPANRAALPGRKSGRAEYFVWSLNNKCRTMPRGKKLRLALLGACLVHWTLDGWATIEDTNTRDTGLGVYAIDLPTDKLTAGVRLTFTRVLAPKTPVGGSKLFRSRRRRLSISPLGWNQGPLRARRQPELLKRVVCYGVTSRRSPKPAAQKVLSFLQDLLRNYHPRNFSVEFLGRLLLGAGNRPVSPLCVENQSAGCGARGVRWCQPAGSCRSLRVWRFRYRGRSRRRIPAGRLSARKHWTKKQKMRLGCAAARACPAGPPCSPGRPGSRMRGRMHSKERDRQRHQLSLRRLQ